MNKADGGDPKGGFVPAEIIYCEAIEAWVFMHPDILTSPEEDEAHDCGWLLRSANTDSYDIIELAEESEFLIWKGLVESDYQVSIECNECEDSESCNYNGVCVSAGDNEEKCKCNERHFGLFCQFELPCKVLRSEKDDNTTLQLIPDPFDDEVDFLQVYGRPMYGTTNLSGIPYPFLRVGFSPDSALHYNVEYPNSTGFNEMEDSIVSPHKHYEDQFLEDDGE